MALAQQHHQQMQSVPPGMQPQQQHPSQTSRKCSPVSSLISQDLGRSETRRSLNSRIRILKRSSNILLGLCKLRPHRQ